MKHTDSSSTLPKPTHDQFQTPQRPVYQSSSRVSKSTAQKRRSSPGLSRSEPPKKRPSLPNSNFAQSTLTQIDFITQTPLPENDHLKYIENAAEGVRSSRQDSKSVPRNNGYDGEGEYRPSHLVGKGISGRGISDDHPKRRRNGGVIQKTPMRNSLIPSQSKGRSKRRPNDKPPSKRDKTLTQMDFVRRYITIDDDDDDEAVDMRYLKTQLPTDSHEEEMPQNTRLKQENTKDLNLPSKCSRRSPGTAEILSANKAIPQADSNLIAGESSKSQDATTFGVPATPRRSRRLEIPSSQSPESPGLAIITSSQFRSATRSPQRTAYKKKIEQRETIKEEIAEGAAEVPELSKIDRIEDFPPSEARSDLLQSTPSSFEDTHGRCHSIELSLREPEMELLSHENPRASRRQRGRTVVYETDADSENDDIDCEPDSPLKRKMSRDEDVDPVQDDRDSPNDDDSEDLPLPTADLTTELDSAPPSEAFMSDASMFYRRQQPATQFPHEPIPTLNTQKLTELFPHEEMSSPTQYTPRSRQNQTQSQEGDQVEIVPESSPARGPEQTTGSRDQGLFQRPRLPEPVIQVESSQPVDRGRHNTDGLLSRSQLLTSSVMESVPMPNFWLGSQDSVGEPYSLPEA